MFRTLVWFLRFTWFFSLIENQRNQGNQPDIGGIAVGSFGSGRDGAQ